MRASGWSVIEITEGLTLLYSRLTISGNNSLRGERLDSRLLEKLTDLTERGSSLGELLVLQKFSSPISRVSACKSS